MKNSSSSSLATFEVCRLALGSAHQTERRGGSLKKREPSGQCAQLQIQILLIIGSHLHLRLFDKIHAGEQKQLKVQTKHKNYGFQ